MMGMSKGVLANWGHFWEVAMASDPVIGNQRRWRQFSLRTLMIAATAVCVLTAISTTVWKELTNPLRFNKRFHRAIRSADRLVVRDMRFGPSGTLNDKEVLFEIGDSDELAALREHLQLAPANSGADGLCMCSGGGPIMDWYRGNSLVARTWLNHGSSLDWDGFPGVIPFTDESSQWIASWFQDHGISIIQEPWSKERIAQKARDILQFADSS